MQRSALNAILVGGLVAGTIDIGAASLINMVGPLRILCVIAGGLLGRGVIRHGGFDIAALGLVLQWAMALIIAAVYVALTSWLPSFRKRWLPSGLVYGVLIFVVMNFVVVPLSALHAPPNLEMPHVIEDIVAMLMFGCIVAYTTQRLALAKSVSFA